MAFTYSGMPPRGFAILPAGRYVIGDPMLVTTEAMWTMIQEKGPGFYVSKDDDPKDWKHIYCMPAYDGSGSYWLSDGRRVKTESGLLAILDARICNEPAWIVSEDVLPITANLGIMAIGHEEMLLLQTAIRWDSDSESDLE